MAGDETRVVLVKPGDVLVFGNVGEFATPKDLARLGKRLKKALGVKDVVLFVGDIDLAVVPRG
ncbi:hypothetical protein OOJ91_13785 [Micromonospora lupini]|uniref:hypothetical protein n=1 Tax=Micromonospora lupini TaxID=285679 RepID=UPI00224EACEF|nr:hypothetical protein [Micromonospora lupini]MCX5066918.1 hypothetical protein [Micromonospora lupini]